MHIPKLESKIITVAELCRRAGVSRQRFYRAKESGELPATYLGKRGAPIEYFSDEAIRILQRNPLHEEQEDDADALDYHTQRLRLEALRAQRAKIRAGLASGELLNAEAATRATNDAWIKLKQRLLQIPAQAARECFGKVDSPHELQVRVEEMTREAFAEMRIEVDGDLILDGRAFLDEIEKEHWS
ncbi:MAG: hypothetical protein AAGF92_17755 [Myxococcota bacterium]